MKRQVFYSFHYGNDYWRVQQIRNIGAIEENEPVSPNEWETVKRQGDAAIKRWINSAMNYRSCVVVLAGSETANRPWVQYEIEHAWEEGKGIVVIYIHKLKDRNGNTSVMGDNPLTKFCIDKTFNYIAKHTTPADKNEINLKSVCKAYNPPCLTSSSTYKYIADHIDEWVEEAISIRKQYP